MGSKIWPGLYTIITVGGCVYEGQVIEESDSSLTINTGYEVILHLPASRIVKITKQTPETL